MSAKKVYKQKYLVKWEKESDFANWLTKAPPNSPNPDNKEAYCKICSTFLAAQKKNLLEHLKTVKHKAALAREKEAVMIPKIDRFAKPLLTENTKISELKLAFFIAEHTSIRTVEHLTTLLKQLDTKSQILNEIEMRRTKCSALIKNVIAPCILKDLLSDIGMSFYSLIVDESTAIDNKKILSVVIKYFSEKKQKIITTFYRLIELRSGTADAISNAILTQLKKDNLSIEKCLGLGVDGANVNIGKNHSLTTIFHSVNPKILIIKCICHSLHLAAEKACESLPRHLDYMIRETHNWFSHSTKRQLEYEELYKSMCNGNQNPKKIPKLSGTRWLAREKSISLVLEQWDPLKKLFQSTENKERCYTTSQLAEMFKVEENKLYLIFINSILSPVIKLNINFQSDKADPMKLFSDLNDLLYSILQKIVVPSQLAKVKYNNLHVYEFTKFLMPANCMDFGYNFNKLSGSLNRDTVEYIKTRCREFVIDLARELQGRIPDNIHILEKVSLFSEKNALSQIKPDISEIVECYKHVCNDVDETIRQWNLLHKIEVKQNLNSTIDYWLEINQLRNSSGERKFGNICNLVFSLMSLPISNAAVERVFSIVNIVKDKLRNQLMTSMVEALLYVRCTSQCECINFTPTSEMLKHFNSQEMYQKISTSETEVLDIFPCDE